ncbi:MAG: hypothetical protein KJZ93_14560 [Caldilineaceae bacterium]|nr:hypothetical protein [Caldilineaceae bacterium]
MEVVAAYGAVSALYLYLPVILVTAILTNLVATWGAMALVALLMVTRPPPRHTPRPLILVLHFTLSQRLE